MDNIINTGISVTIIGMGIVFAVLIILWGVLEAMKLIFDPGNKKEKKNENIVTAQPPQSSDDDESLIAVITAAIAAMLDKPANSLRISSIKRLVDTSPEWGKTGRKSFLNNRFN